MNALCEGKNDLGFIILESGSHDVALAGLEHRDLPVFAAQVKGLRVWDT